MPRGKGLVDAANMKRRAASVLSSRKRGHMLRGTKTFNSKWLWDGARFYKTCVVCGATLTAGKEGIGGDALDRNCFDVVEEKRERELARSLF